MADAKITDLTALTGAGMASGDLFVVVDVSDTTMAASGTNKKITGAELLIGLGALPLAGGTMTGTLIIDRNLGAGSSVMTQWANAGTVLAQMTTNSSRSQSVFQVGRLLGYFGSGTQNFDFDANTGAVGLGSGSIIKFAPDAFLNSFDTGLKRNAAGVLEINNGTAGTYRDLKARSVFLEASTTSQASLRIAHGSAPTSPVDGDMWTTTAGLYVRINGVTVGPLS